MRNDRRRASWIAALLLPMLVIGFAAQSQPAGQQSPDGQHQTTNQQVQCVNREARAKPPPHAPGPPPRAYSGGRSGTRAGVSAMKPVCPEGQVPIVREQRVQRGVVVPKGNPLLRPGAGTPDGLLQPGAIRSFGEVYGRTPQTARERQPGPPPSPPGPPACVGVSSFGSCYYYGAAAFTRTADGAGMTMSVNQPAYNNSGGAGHSLDEIAVQGGSGNGNIVELGWLVSSEQEGDSDPHIFVFHWKNWNGTCYDGCGWQQYSSTYYPGQSISGLVGREVYIGYVFYQGNWWAWFDNQWLGYFPGSEWDNGYTQSTLIQWFGEVASANGVPPKTQMGDGMLPPSPRAAHMTTLCDVDAKAWVCWYRDKQLLNATVPKYYNVLRVGFGEARYGGPGQ